MPASVGRGDLTSGSDRLDSVEIKVTFSGAGAAAATRALAPDTGGARRRVYFCEALARSTAPGQLPLLDAGLILRLRAGSGRGGAATAELRPCRRSRLSERWLRFREQGPDSLCLTNVWSGDRRVLSAALVSDCGRTAVEAAATGAEPLASVFSDHQRAFLADCADTAVGFGSLSVLGPVHTIRWRGIRLDHHEVTLERCGLAADGDDDDPLQWLEVSKRVAPEGAEVVQASLTALLKAKGLEPDLGSGIPVRRVLEELVAKGA
ncbi:hypothetical protein [Streptomyces ipomoeae]|uniref:hypothetical protein n=1 Tax=Streptomyces ipomoeae TaxID=103232 RepID=UPI0011468D3C|nr:hypothetical protein [Streptomyces ipomoeae]MDX2935372.1 hypothetical protein [Streptomyces ipomoeae]TQE19969.1 hypothetical protein SipoB123_29990 [Streptomyces ipomoeae]